MNISVIIPAYNKGEHLIEVVKAVLNQTVKPYEIIVSHSGCNDPTDLLKQFGDKIILLHTDHGLFAGAARNKGAMIASGDWFAFFDEDVVPESNCLEQFIDAVHRHPKKKLFAGSVSVAKAGGYWGMCLWYIEFGSQHPYLTEKAANTMAGCNNFISAEAFRSVNGYPTTMKIGEDAFLQMKINTKYGPLIFVPNAIGYHFNRSGFRYYVKHLLPLGRGAADIRAICGTIERKLLNYPILILFLPFARTILLFKRSLRHTNKNKWQLFGFLPGIILGFCIWSYSFFMQARRLAQSFKPRAPDEM